MKVSCKTDHIINTLFLHLFTLQLLFTALEAAFLIDGHARSSMRKVTSNRDCPSLGDITTSFKIKDTMQLTRSGMKLDDFSMKDCGVSNESAKNLVLHMLFSYASFLDEDLDPEIKEEKIHLHKKRIFEAFEKFKDKNHILHSFVAEKGFPNKGAHTDKEASKILREYITKRDKLTRDKVTLSTNKMNAHKRLLVEIFEVFGQSNQLILPEKNINNDITIAYTVISGFAKERYKEEILHFSVPHVYKYELEKSGGFLTDWELYGAHAVIINLQRSCEKMQISMCVCSSGSALSNAASVDSTLPKKAGEKGKENLLQAKVIVNSYKNVKKVILEICEKEQSEYTEENADSASTNPSASTCQHKRPAGAKKNLKEKKNRKKKNSHKKSQAQNTSTKKIDASETNQDTPDDEDEQEIEIRRFIEQEEAADDQKKSIFSTFKPYEKYIVEIPKEESFVVESKSSPNAAANRKKAERKKRLKEQLRNKYKAVKADTPEQSSSEAAELNDSYLTEKREKQLEKLQASKQDYIANIHAHLEKIENPYKIDIDLQTKFVQDQLKTFIDRECASMSVEQLENLEHDFSSAFHKWLKLSNALRTEKASEEMLKFYKNVKQSSKTKRLKEKLRETLHEAISSVFGESELYMVGSSSNGFGNERSDMDLSLIIVELTKQQKTAQKEEANLKKIEKAKKAQIKVLSEIQQIFQDTMMKNRHEIVDSSRPKIIDSQELIHSKVPILRISFNGEFQGVTVDLNVNNNPAAIRNTHLLYHYSKFDARVAPLVLVIKAWAKKHRINDARKWSLSSYSWVLMVIHYLQSGVQPKVLPFLEAIYPEEFSTDLPVNKLKFNLQLNSLPKDMWDSDASQKHTLLGLLLGFLQYYAKFKFTQEKISIRQQNYLEKTSNTADLTEKSPADHEYAILIEEPFTFHNTADSVGLGTIYEQIKAQFQQSLEDLYMNMNLSSIVDLYSHLSSHD